MSCQHMYNVYVHTYSVHIPIQIIIIMTGKDYRATVEDDTVDNDGQQSVIMLTVCVRACVRACVHACKGR